MPESQDLLHVTLSTCLVARLLINCFELFASRQQQRRLAMADPVKKQLKRGKRKHGMRDDLDSFLLVAKI